jgi:hypothetical protein
MKLNIRTVRIKYLDVTLVLNHCYSFSTSVLTTRKILDNLTTYQDKIGSGCHCHKSPQSPISIACPRATRGTHIAARTSNFLFNFCSPNTSREGVMVNFAEVE